LQRAIDEVRTLLVSLPKGGSKSELFLFMVALCNRADHYIFILFLLLLLLLLLSFFFFFLA